MTVVLDLLLLRRTWVLTPVIRDVADHPTVGLFLDPVGIALSATG